MPRPGRNEPCPCGSGKKYKHCCLRRERKRETERHLAGQAPEIALGWLRRHHAEAVDKAVAEQFLRLDGEELERFEQLPDDHFTGIMINAHEWLLAEGRIDVDDGARDVAVMDLVLGPGGPRLDAGQRAFLEQLASRPLGLYEIVECQPGQGFRLRDVQAPKEPDRWIEEHAGSQTLRRGQILGARLIPGDPWTLCGAIYAIPRHDYLRLLERLRDELAAGRQDERKPAIVSAVIIDHWLAIFLAPPPELVDAASGEALMLVQDRYEVGDWDRLAAALAAEDDVEGDRDHGWTRFQELDDDTRRSLLHLDVLRRQDRLVVFARALKMAGEGREWLERVAAGSVTHVIRDISDPAHVWEEPG